jgi:4-azaleucine resistance transporter AzlC
MLAPVIPTRSPHAIHALRGALTLSVPVALGYVPLGAVFGFVFVQAGADWWMPVLASLLVYAGAAQFMMVPLLVSGTPLGTLALAALAINFRHVFYGLALLHRRAKHPAARAYQSFTLTDETFAIVSTMDNQVSPNHLVAIGALNHLWWNLGTLLGVAAGVTLDINVVGLDFALTALFTVLLVEQLRRHGRHDMLALGLVAYALARWWQPEHALLLSMLFTVTLGLAWPQPASRTRP